MTIWRHNFAGWAEGATINANSGTGSGDQLTRVIRGTGATITATAAAAMGGATKGATLAAPTNIAASLGWMPITTFNALACSVHLKTDTIPTVDAQRLVQPYRGAGSSSAPRIVAMSAGTLRFLDAGGGTLATTAVQTLAQWQAGFDIRLYLVTGTTTANGTLQARITRLSDAAVIMDTGVLTGNAQIDGFQGFEAGKVSTGTAWTGTKYLANMAMDNAATGLIDPVGSTGANVAAVAATVAVAQPIPEVAAETTVPSSGPTVITTAGRTAVVTAGAAVQGVRATTSTAALPPAVSAGIVVVATVATASSAARSPVASAGATSQAVPTTAQAGVPVAAVSASIAVAAASPAPVTAAVRAPSVTGASATGVAAIRATISTDTPVPTVTAVRTAVVQAVPATASSAARVASVAAGAQVVASIAAGSLAARAPSATGGAGVVGVKAALIAAAIPSAVSSEVNVTVEAVSLGITSATPAVIATSEVTATVTAPLLDAVMTVMAPAVVGHGPIVHGPSREVVVGIRPDRYVITMEAR